MVEDRQPDPKPTPPKAPTPTPPVPRDDSLAANEVANFPNLTIAITRVEIAPARITVLGRAAITNKPCLQVGLHLVNTSKTTKLNYKPWAGTIFMGRCFLSDEFDNHYKLISPGLGDRIIGQVSDDTSLYPSKELEDLLVFEPPIDTAKHLTLILPGDAVGRPGAIRYRLDILSKEEKDAAAAEADRVRQAEAKARAEAEAKVRAREAANRAARDSQLREAALAAEKERKDAQEQRKREIAEVKQRERDEDYAESQVKFARKLIARAEGADRAEAKDRLEKVLKDYSGTKAAAEAREMLAALGQ